MDAVAAVTVMRVLLLVVSMQRECEGVIDKNKKDFIL